MTPTEYGQLPQAEQREPFECKMMGWKGWKVKTAEGYRLLFTDPIESEPPTGTGTERGNTSGSN